MTQTESTLITPHAARAQLEEKYPREQYPDFDAHLAAFGSTGWRNWFHRRVPETELARHDTTQLCSTCYLMAELCILHGIPMLRRKMLEHIQQTFSPEGISGSRLDSMRAWKQAQEILVAELADAVFLDTIGVLSLRVEDDSLLCQVAANACIQSWTERGFSSSVVDRNVERIHDAFGWHCRFPHPSSD